MKYSSMMLNNKHCLYIFIIFIALFLGFFTHPQAFAHGGGTPKLINADIGPYWISTWVRPDPPETENFHLTIALTEPTDPTATIREAGPPILNAIIQIQLRSTEEPDQVITMFASHENAVNKFLYEADLKLPYPGIWHGLIIVQGKDGGRGEISLDPIAVSGPSLNITWIVVTGVVIFLLALWLLRRSLLSVSDPS